MFSFAMPELILILVIALVVFGPGKLPELGKALGKGMQEFRRATGEVVEEKAINIEAKAIEEKNRLDKLPAAESERRAAGVNSQEQR
ncbi:MAG TPA: twin-arginine translocase TatA/TatE family subunit [Methylomusa anaerophila]|uniref:Sec-independent protein translocase protein TatA n=1 Tax=Methylomusa anaerophila TaxID=1930071 RepID=A0A348ALY1_9FIRM|nr:twin-arginine translocase TatA/TatE family subunit [Methylomusa anaerophila]BBB92079.1 Sec-independent protein translocase protein TatAd [Methylomusa anaerophila]HML87908.1 twin-arginine translocase TatA/TatE family subunit [Methylomusa anaerophila]